MKRIALLSYFLFTSMALAEPTKLSTVLNEGDTGYLTVTFKDQNGVAITPNTIKWWVDDESSSTNVVPVQTAIPTPGVTTYTLEIHECGQRALSNRSSENRIFTLAFTYGLSFATPTGTLTAGTPTPLRSGPQSANEYARYTVNNLPYLNVGGTYPDCAATPLISTPTPNP